MASVNSLVTHETLLRTIRAQLPPGHKRREIIQGLERRENETLFSTHISSKDTLLTEDAVDGITTNLRVHQLSNPPPRFPMANYLSVEYFEISCPVDPKWAFSMIANLPSVTFVKFGSSAFEKFVFLNENELRSEMGRCCKLRELHVKTDPAKLSKMTHFSSILGQLESILDYAGLHCPNLQRAELTLPLQMKNKLDDFLTRMPKLLVNAKMRKEVFKDDLVYFTTNPTQAAAPQPQQYSPPAPIPIIQQLPPPTPRTPCVQQQPTNEITMTTTTVLVSPPLPPPVEVDCQMTNSSAATATTRVKSQSPVLASSTDTPTTTTPATTRTMVSDPRARPRHRHQGQQRSQRQQQQQQMTWNAPTSSGQRQQRKRRFCSLESNQSTGSSEKYDPFEEATLEPDDYYGNVDGSDGGGSGCDAVVGQISDDYEDDDDEDRPLIIYDSATATKTTARIDLSPTPVPAPPPPKLATAPPLHTNNMHSLSNTNFGFQPPLPRTPPPQSQESQLPPPPPSTQFLHGLEQGKIPNLEPLWYDKAKNILTLVGEKATGNGGCNGSMTTASHLIPAGLILNGPENREAAEGQRPPNAKKSKITATASAVTDKIVKGGNVDNVKLLNDKEFQNLYTRPDRKNNKKGNNSSNATADSNEPRYCRRF